MTRHTGCFIAWSKFSTFRSGTYRHVMFQAVGPYVSASNTERALSLSLAGDIVLSTFTVYQQLELPETRRWATPSWYGPFHHIPNYAPPPPLQGWAGQDASLRQNLGHRPLWTQSTIDTYSIGHDEKARVSQLSRVSWVNSRLEQKYREYAKELQYVPCLSLLYNLLKICIFPIFSRWHGTIVLFLCRYQMYFLICLTGWVAYFSLFSISFLMVKINISFYPSSKKNLKTWARKNVCFPTVIFTNFSRISFSPKIRTLVVLVLGSGTGFGSAFFSSSANSRYISVMNFYVYMYTLFEMK